MKPRILLIGAFIFALAGCGPVQQTTILKLDLTPLASPNVLSTPYAQQPAAGICASPGGNVVTVTIYPDIPAPRCTIVRPDQKLQVINRTLADLQVSIGRFTSTIPAGGDHTFDVPFGKYLAPGVHQLQVLPCCGPEIWLQEPSP